MWDWTREALCVAGGLGVQGQGWRHRGPWAGLCEKDSLRPTASARGLAWSMYACACVCASQWLPLGVCVPAFCPHVPLPPHTCMCAPPHRAVSHQLTQLSPRGRGPFLLRKLSDSPPLCVHTCRGCATCPGSRGIDAMSFSRRFTGNFLEFQEFGGLSSGQRQKGQGDRKINLRQRHSFRVTASQEVAWRGWEVMGLAVRIPRRWLLPTPDPGRAQSPGCQAPEYGTQPGMERGDSKFEGTKTPKLPRAPVPHLLNEMCWKSLSPKLVRIGWN